jgi:hypothetical protein
LTITIILHIILLGFDKERACQVSIEVTFRWVELDRVVLEADTEAELRSKLKTWSLQSGQCGTRLLLAGAGYPDGPESEHDEAFPACQ